MATYLVRADGSILVLPADAVSPAGLGDKAKQQFQELGELVQDVARDLFTGVASIAGGISEVTMTFSVGMEGETGLPLIAKGKADANIEVQVKWEKAEPSAGPS